MKSNATLLNLSRGEIMNVEDVLAHLDANPNFWVGQDTHINEPKLTTGKFTSKLT